MVEIKKSTSPEIANAIASGWLAPGQPLTPSTPSNVGGRQFDYPVGININYIPRAYEQLSFAQLRALADSHPIIRYAIEKRKDQLESIPWNIRPTSNRPMTSKLQSQIDEVKQFFAYPDRHHDFTTWFRMSLEDEVVIDALTLYPRHALDGSLYSLEHIDGATIKPILDYYGRCPDPPNPAYQQIIKGIPIANLDSTEILYLPRNVRSNRLYGYSLVEQLVLTINLLLRKDATQMAYYNTGTIPDAFGTIKDNFVSTPEQLKAFQSAWDNMMAGEVNKKSGGVKFMFEGTTITPVRAPPLKDEFDEWLVRQVCAIFSLPPSAFVGQVNRATAQTLKTQSEEEGLIPWQNRYENIFNMIIQRPNLLNFPDLEFVFVTQEQVDPEIQSKTLIGYVNAGLMTVNEARNQLNLQSVDNGDVLTALTPQGFSGRDFSLANQTLPKQEITPQNEPNNSEKSKIQKKKSFRCCSSQLQWPVKKQATHITIEGKKYKVGKPAILPSNIHNVFTANYKKILIQALNKAQKSIISQLKTKLNKLSKDDNKEKKSKDEVDQIISSLDMSDLQDVAGDLADSTNDAAESIANQAATEVGLDTSDNILMKKIIDQAVMISRERAAELVGMTYDQESGEYVQSDNPDMAITDSTRELLNNIITSGIEDGSSVDEISDNIESSTIFSADRADLIANTEIAKINSLAAVETYKQADDNGIPTLKIWLLGAEPCDDCQGNADDGAIYLDDSFSDGNTEPPGHPRCECAIAPVVGE